MWPFKKRKAGTSSGTTGSPGGAGDGANGNGRGNGGKGSKPTASLSDLARGLQHAAASTSALMAEQYLDIFDQFFDKGPANSYRPKLVRVVMPDGLLAEVPLFTLVSPKSMGLNRMRTCVKATVEDIQQFRREDRLFDASRTNFTVSIREKESREKSSGSDVLDLELEFVAGEAPQAVTRLLEQFTHQVRILEPMARSSGTASGNGDPRRPNESGKPSGNL